MNWVSKTQYLERRIKKLETTLKLLTDHMQVDKDGNIVIEANKFDLHTNDTLKVISYDNLEIYADSAIYIGSDSDVSIGDKKLDNWIGVVDGIIRTEAENNIVLKTSQSIELQPTDRLTSTKALEVVE